MRKSWAIWSNHMLKSSHHHLSTQIRTIHNKSNSLLIIRLALILTFMRFQLIWWGKRRILISLRLSRLRISWNSSLGLIMILSHLLELRSIVPSVWAYRLKDAYRIFTLRWRMWLTRLSKLVNTLHQRSFSDSTDT